MHVSLSKKKLFSHLGQAFCYTGYAGASISLAILLVGFVPQMEGNEVRRPISKDVLELRPEDYPQPIVNAGGWSVRAAINKESFADTYAPDYAKKPTTWVHFDPHGISLNTMDGINLQEATTALSLVFAYDTEAKLALHTQRRHTAQSDQVNLSGTLGNKAQSGLLSLQRENAGEALSEHGQPLRWEHAAHAANKTDFVRMCTVRPSSPPSIDAVRSKLLAQIPRHYGIPRGGGSVMARAERYKDIIAKAAARFGIREALIYAVIHTESNFYPHVVSPANATGLMQLLPGTARTMHKYVFGYAIPMNFEQIANPEMNITLGVAFLKMLMTHHFSEISDSRSREYCAIASYNMGPARLYPFFGASKEEAITTINALSPDAVFERLITELPYRETRAYVSQVNSRQHVFAEF